MKTFTLDYFKRQGARGGAARAANMTERERSSAARAAAFARGAHGEAQCLKCRYQWRKRIAGRPSACPKCHCLQWDSIARK